VASLDLVLRETVTRESPLLANPKAIGWLRVFADMKIRMCAFGVWLRIWASQDPNKTHRDRRNVA
jgi:hypothetical protein